MILANTLSQPARGVPDSYNNRREHSLINGEMMMGMLVELMPQTGLSPEDIDLKVKSFLGENGVDVDDAFMIGNAIMQMAVQADEPPEQTVVGAFITGLSLGIMMHNKGALST